MHLKVFTIFHSNFDFSIFFIGELLHNKAILSLKNNATAVLGLHDIRSKNN